jgi:kynurenine formamidase
MAGKDGIASRGVLLDIPLTRGVDWLEPGDPISIEDLKAAEKLHDVRVEEGDILMVATGRHARREAKGDWNAIEEGLAGLHPECVPWLHERRVAAIGSDGISDVVPGLGITGWFVPVHQMGIAGIGLHLLDNLDLRALSQACIERKRHAFFFVVAPLRVKGGTGSPVNPIAFF